MLATRLLGVLLLLVLSPLSASAAFIPLSGQRVVQCEVDDGTTFGAARFGPLNGAWSDRVDFSHTTFDTTYVLSAQQSSTIGPNGVFDSGHILLDRQGGEERRFAIAQSLIDIRFRITEPASYVLRLDAPEFAPFRSMIVIGVRTATNESFTGMGPNGPSRIRTGIIEPGEYSLTTTIYQSTSASVTTEGEFAYAWSFVVPEPPCAFVLLAAMVFRRRRRSEIAPSRGSSDVKAKQLPFKAR